MIGVVNEDRQFLGVDWVLSMATKYKGWDVVTSFLL